MQKLSKAAIGRSYTIQWMFGVPEVMDFLREHHVEEGDNIQIIRKLKDALIVGVKGSRFAMGNEIADRIQVSKIIKRQRIRSGRVTTWQIYFAMVWHAFLDQKMDS